MGRGPAAALLASNSAYDMAATGVTATATALPAGGQPVCKPTAAHCGWNSLPPRYHLLAGLSLKASLHAFHGQLPLPMGVGARAPHTGRVHPPLDSSHESRKCTHAACAEPSPPPPGYKCSPPAAQLPRTLGAG